jgi:hypothetical protein
MIACLLCYIDSEFDVRWGLVSCYSHGHSTILRLASGDPGVLFVADYITPDIISDMHTPVCW